METGKITTPFGRRPMTLALVRRQIQTSESKTGRTVDKWRVFRDTGDARSLLGLQDRALTVLNALLSFYPASELSEEKGLIVFPSNAQLSIRANGIAGTTLRKNLAALVDAGLIIRKDSPNGKRYARKGDGGRIEDAYGFSLAPLVARADELAAMAQQMELERRRFRMIKDRVSIARRDVRKLISAAIEEGASGDWGRAESCFVDVVGRIPRRPTTADLEAIADELALLHEEVVRMLENQLNFEKNDGNAIASGCHIQNSNTESCNESEPRFEKKQNVKPEPSNLTKYPIQTFPLEMVLRGCPEIKPFGPGGSIANWRDLMAAAVSVRSMLGVSPSAYEEACGIMGQATAAAVIACIYERSGHINSAGGYLRDLTAKARRGEFSMGPMLIALIRGNTVAGRASA
jgi:replication initiation protein RepC